jgi:predicted NUDIX family NTP pyrophosphohydrolase
MYRLKEGRLEVLLVHPGGPFWARKDKGAWSIPKGIIDEGEDDLEAAKREFEEETGFSVSGRFIPLGEQRIKSGKVIRAWAVEGEIDTSRIRSNTFQMEWPPRSGRMREFPEIDRAEWFDVQQAKERINPGQIGFIKELEKVIKR